MSAKASKEALKVALDMLNEITGVLGIVLKVEEDIPAEITELVEQRAAANGA